jgi:hypothetical protein
VASFDTPLPITIGFTIDNRCYRDCVAFGGAPDRHTTPSVALCIAATVDTFMGEHKINAWEEVDLKLAEDTQCPVALRKLSRFHPAESC